MSSQRDFFRFDSIWFEICLPPFRCASIADRIRFSVEEPYRREFENKESEQFITLATDISDGLRELFRQSYESDDDDVDLTCKLLRVE